MKKIIAAGVAALGISLGLASPAQADPTDDYLLDLQYGGYGRYSAQQALLIGGLACASPLPMAQQVQVVYENTALSISRADAQYIVESAHMYLCPRGGELNAA